MDEIKIPEKLQAWVEARERHGLSHAEVQMGRELGFKPRKLTRRMKPVEGGQGSSVGEFIVAAYRERFGRDLPEDERSIEERSSAIAAKKQLKRQARLDGRDGPAEGPGDAGLDD